MEDWKKMALGDIAIKFFSGGTPSTKDSSLWGGDIQWITSKWLNEMLYLSNGEKKISEKGLKNSATKLVKARSLILATRVGVGKVSINEIDLAINQDLLGIEIDEKNYSLEFLAYQLRSENPQDFINSFKRGATIQGVTKDCIKSIELNIPLLHEQHQIAHVLSTVQKAIEQQDKLIRTTIELKKALMQKLFTEGTRGEPQKETEIGLVPESWEVVELGKHSYIRTSFPTFNKLTAKYKSVEQGTEFFFLKVSDMNIAGNEIFIYESNNKFLNDKPTNFTNGFIKPNSLIFPKRGAAISTNKKRITTKYSVLDPNLIGVEPNSNVNGKFLYNYFEMFDLSSLQDNNVIPQLNKHNVAGVKLPLPSVEEQQIISKDIEIFDDKIKLIAKKKQTLTALFKTLLYELMTGQRRVHELEFEKMEEFQ